MAIENPPVPPQQHPLIGPDGRMSEPWYDYVVRLRAFLEELNTRLTALEP